MKIHSLRKEDKMLQGKNIDYIANDPFPAESHEEGLDRAMMAVQQLQEEVDRSIKLSRTNTMTSTEFTVGDTERAGTEPALQCPHGVPFLRKGQGGC